MENIFETKDLSKFYGKYKALDGLNMSIPKGSIYGFVGKNGAGKTTLMRLLCGLQLPTSGSFQLMGVNHTDKNILNVRKKIAAVVESPAIYGELNAYNNLRLQCLNVGLPDYKGINEILQLVGIADTGRKKAKNFSLGMKQRLGIAIALVSHPDFLILDEPTNGLDPQGIIEIRELVLKLNREHGITVLISSHILDELSRLATHYGFIDKGKIVRQMSASELEKECGKSIRMKVDDTNKLAGVLEKMGIDYKIIDSHTADVFSDLKFSEIAVNFANDGCDIISMEEHDESLEAFFLSLIGGEESA